MVIYLILSFSIAPTALAAIDEAIQEYENKTCVRFKQRTTEDLDFVRFHDGYTYVNH